ncbi:MAG: sodium/glucose cotransporter, partial [Cyclobacteriaceae bacterium]|nr:sodium/glucose cotransporter [Cyclobacteriaceae bacterium]
LTTKDAFYDLPGLAVLFGAMWITNFGYWGFNQYIIQKGLAAKSLDEAKKGLVFAGYLKLLVPLLVIIPGITAYVLINNYSPEELSVMIGKPIEAIGEIGKSDEAYPWLLKNFVPVGVRGLAFAALVAAIVSSLASMINSTSTIFTVDIYRNYMNKEATNKQMVLVGRIVAFIALLIASLAAQPLLGGLDQAFQYIQEFTGFIYPGVCVVFFMGLFWRQATTNAAWFAAAGTFAFSIIFKMIIPDSPFQLRMGYVFIILVFGASLISFLDKGKKVQSACPESFMGKAALNTGWALIVVATIGIILGLTLSKPLEHLAFSSIYMFSIMIAFVGGILITNVKMKVADAKAIDVDKEIFKTRPVFNIAALGIVVIFILLYFLFW